MKYTTHIALLACALATSPAWAQSPSGHGAHGAHAQDATSPAAEATEGEVRRIDTSNRKITLRHGEIKNLQMPPMTMVFEVKDASLLDRVKQGDKVRFTAEQAGGVFTVTSIEALR
jgi:Cu/Ag efflux protein CusF